MPTYVSLINWTDEGIADFAQTVDRADAANQLAAKFGARLKGRLLDDRPLRRRRRLGSP